MRHPFLKTFLIVTFVVFLAAACSGDEEAKATYSGRTPIASSWPDHENENASAGGPTAGGSSKGAQGGASKGAQGGASKGAQGGAAKGAQGGAAKGAQKGSELGENEIVEGIEAGPVAIDTVAFGQRHISQRDGQYWAAITISSVKVVATHRDSRRAESERFGPSNCVIVKGTVEALIDEPISVPNPHVFADGFSQDSSFCLDPAEIAGMPFGPHIRVGHDGTKSTEFFLLYTTYEDSIDFLSFGGEGHFSQSGGPLEVAVFQKSDVPGPGRHRNRVGTNLPSLIGWLV